MENISLKDIDFKSLKLLKCQGTQSTIYESGNICIKIFKNVKKEDQKILYRKFKEMSGISIKNVLMPIDLIMENGTLRGYTMENFKNSSCLYNRFTANRYENSKNILQALKKASIILKEIHNSGIVCQDLSFDNILIDNHNNIKYCDIDGCAYHHYQSPYISILLKRYLFDYRGEDFWMPSKNFDRMSFMLSFYILMYCRELQSLSNRQYNSLAGSIKTIENTTKYANRLIDTNHKLPFIPYMDELIENNDNYVIDRSKQFSIGEKIRIKLLEGKNNNDKK